MKAARARAATLGTALVVLLGPLLAPGPAQAGDSPDRDDAPVLTARSHDSPETRVKRLTVEWRGRQRRPRRVRSAAVPGIGRLSLICRPRDTRIRLYASDRGHETQMWLQKYETKRGRRVVSVKTPRIYRYAHADDDGTGGTGFAAHEGLNQRRRVENRSQDGYAYGVISQRPGRHLSGASEPPPPVTTFEVTWFWNGFRHPRRYRYCKIDAVLTTHYADPLSVTWHGDQDPAPTTDTESVRGIGQITLSCPRAGADRDQALWVRPTTRNARLYVETVTGEGLVEHHVAVDDVELDHRTGLLGPVRLPSNGTMRLQVSNGGTQRWLLVSSYHVTNDSERPHRNLCEVAAGWYRR